MTPGDTRDEGSNVDFNGQNGHQVVAGNGQLKDLLNARPASERAALYSAFDQLLQENLARSQELLRHAMTLTSADRDAEQRLAVERQRHQATLSALLEELQGAEQQAQQVAQSVAGLALSITRLSERVLVELAAEEVAPTAASASDATATEGEQPAAWPTASDVEAPAGALGEAPNWDESAVESVALEAEDAVSRDAFAAETGAAWEESAGVAAGLESNDVQFPSPEPQTADHPWAAAIPLDEESAAAGEAEVVAGEPDAGDAAFIEAMAALADEVAATTEGEEDGAEVGTGELSANAVSDTPTAFDELFADPLPTGEDNAFAWPDDGVVDEAGRPADLVFADAAMGSPSAVAFEASHQDDLSASRPAAAWAPWRRDRS